MSSPSWLSPTDDVTPDHRSSALEVDSNQQAPTLDRPAADVVSPEDEKDLPGIILTMRLANIGVAAGLMTCSIVLVVGLPPISTWVLAIYSIVGALLICCLETQLKFLRVVIAVNFGFLFNSTWRFVYYLILSSVAWSYDTLFGKIMAIALAAVAIFNTYVLCRYPSYRRMREKIAEEEDKRIEARISKEVKKQAVGAIKSGGR